MTVILRDSKRLFIAWQPNIRWWRLSPYYKSDAAYSFVIWRLEVSFKRRRRSASQ